MKINKVVICGLGALGLTYAAQLKDVCDLRILANIERIEKYKKNPPMLNGKTIELNYTDPSEGGIADFVIISTKSSGLQTALEYIKNFVDSNTIIISLINGISSENIIAERYGKESVVRSYFIGHSAIRTNNCVTQDGIGKIVIEKNVRLENFFNSVGINYEAADDIIYSQWVKLGVNIILNEPSALFRLTVGELRSKRDYKHLAENLLTEVKKVAQKHGVRNLQNYEKDVFASTNLVSDEGKTSMYQDILAGRKTEVDIFSGEIIKLGKLYGVETPYNNKIYEQLVEITKI